MRDILKKEEEKKISQIKISNYHANYTGMQRRHYQKILLSVAAFGKSCNGCHFK